MKEGTYQGFSGASSEFSWSTNIAPLAGARRHPEMLPGEMDHHQYAQDSKPTSHAIGATIGRTRVFRGCCRFVGLWSIMLPSIRSSTKDQPITYFWDTPIIHGKARALLFACPSFCLSTCLSPFLLHLSPVVFHLSRPTLNTLGRMLLHLSPLVCLLVSLLRYFWPDDFYTCMPLVSLLVFQKWIDFRRWPDAKSL